MTVDLTKLKAGDSVKLRCGAILKVMTDVKINSGTGVYINFYGYQQSMYYYWHNASIDTILTTPLDILEIIPAPFDWDKVEQGDAFETSDNIVYFLSHDWHAETLAIVVSDICGGASYCEKSKLTPRPDIPNAKK